MDEYKLIWERSSTLDLGHPEHATQDKEYIIVAMLMEFREIITKAGKKMAFGLLEDYAGSIEIVVFPIPWSNSDRSLPPIRCIA